MHSEIWHHTAIKLKMRERVLVKSYSHVPKVGSDQGDFCFRRRRFNAVENREAQHTRPLRIPVPRRGSLSFLFHVDKKGLVVKRTSVLGSFWADCVQ